MTARRGAGLDVVAFGEGQLRLSSPPGVALAQAQDLRSDVAGTEGNVLGLLSQLGATAGLVTALPKTPLGRRVAAEYQRAGLDLSACVWTDDGRLALYFVDQGSPPIPSRVFYDRKDSCFSRLTAADVDWDYIASARLLHLSGITAALGEGLYGVLTSAVARARSQSQLVSVDVNYRTLLWSADVARTQLQPLMQGADVVFCSRRDAASVFDIHGETPSVAEALATRFAARIVAVSDGADPVAVWADGQQFGAAPPRTTVVDRVGAGDAFVGGFLHGVLHDDIEAGLRLGIAAAALTLTRRGDMLVTSIDELEWASASFQSGTDIVR